MCSSDLSISAERMRRKRDREQVQASHLDALPSQCDSVSSQSYPQSVTCDTDIEIDIEKEKRVNSKTKEKNVRPKTDKGVPVGFDLFLNIYPRKVGKKEATKAWLQLDPDETTVTAIVAGVERWKRSDQWTKDEGRFIPYPATFLRGERWNEEDRADVAPAQKAAPAKKSYDDDEDFLKG